MKTHKNTQQVLNSPTINDQAWKIHYNIASLYHKQRNFEKALKYYSEAIRLEGAVVCVFQRGVLYHEENQLKHAVIDYSNSLRVCLFPHSPHRISNINGLKIQAD
jgi:tetratricopeptide (TPR) repeat protein